MVAYFCCLGISLQQIYAVHCEISVYLLVGVIQAYTAMGAVGHHKLVRLRINSMAIQKSRKSNDCTKWFCYSGILRLGQAVEIKWYVYPNVLKSGQNGSSAAFSDRTGMERSSSLMCGEQSWQSSSTVLYPNMGRVTTTPRSCKFLHYSKRKWYLLYVHPWLNPIHTITLQYLGSL